MIDAADLLARHAAAVDGYLRGRLREVCGLADAPPRLAESVDYSLLAGGKRLRPALVIESCLCCGGTADKALPAAAAVELVHAFSLVHDDLPAMDDDDLRRGRPTNHRVFGEATAILAGDAMTAMAFEVLARDGGRDAASMVADLARAAGPTGMIGGQQLDMEAEGRRLDVDGLRQIHARKTGDLLAVSCRLGGRCAGADDGKLAALTDFGRHLGLAFQIADDLLDVESTPESTGKATNKDAAAGKNTYPSLLGVAEARRLAAAESEAAIAAVAGFGDRAAGLRSLAKFAAERRR